MTEKTFSPLTRSLEDFAKASAIGLYLSSFPDDKTSNEVYDALQEDHQYLNECAVWEPFEELAPPKVTALIFDQYTQNLEDYQAVRNVARDEVRDLVENLTAIINEELLPAAARIAIQDFRRLNETLIASSKFLAETTPPEEQTA